MQSGYLIKFILLYLIAGTFFSCTNKFDYMAQQPIAEKKDTVLEIHGDKRIDSYYWMNDRKNPDLIDYLNKENTYLDNVMSDYKEVRGRFV
jgi:Protease II